MDFFQGIFGKGSTPPSTPPANAQRPAKTITKNGPFTHPVFPHLVYAVAMTPPPDSNGGCVFIFYLWDRGVPSFYRFVTKKAGDSTPSTLFQGLSNPNSWVPSDPEARPIESISFLMPSSASSSGKNSQKSPEEPQRVTLKIAPRSTATNPVGLSINPPLDIFQDMTTSYFERLNKLLVTVDKKVAADPENLPAHHPAFYACLLECTHLLYHVYNDQTLNDSQRETRYRTINEWVTRLLLSLDNIQIPLVPDPDHPGPIPKEEADLHVVADPVLRARRKSLINLSLGIGAELGALISGKSAPITSIPTTSDRPLVADPASLSSGPWDSPNSPSPVLALLREATPPKPINHAHPSK